MPVRVEVPLDILLEHDSMYILIRWNSWEQFVLLERAGISHHHVEEHWEVMRDQVELLVARVHMSHLTASGVHFLIVDLPVSIANFACAFT